MPIVDWVEVWQTRITNLLSRRFLGFIIAVVAGWTKPETLSLMITLYALLIASKVGQEWVRTRRDGTNGDNEGSS